MRALAERVQSLRSLRTPTPALAPEQLLVLAGIEPDANLFFSVRSFAAPFDLHVSFGPRGAQRSSLQGAMPSICLDRTCD